MDLFDLIFPKKCLGCGATRKYICETCAKKTQKAYLVCPHCKNFSVNGDTHEHCKPNTSLDGVIAIFKYEGVVKRAIKRIKYNFNYDIASELVELASFQSVDFENFVLVPVPMHAIRQRWRGFNQAEILGEVIAKNLNLDYKKDLLIRTKNSHHQVGLGRQERLRSIRGVFAENPSDSTKRIVQSAKGIVIFDDVWTTGATLNEAAKVLKKAGAKIVWGLTIAR